MAQPLIGTGNVAVGLVAQGTIAIGLVYAQGMFSIGLFSTGFAAIGYSAFGFIRRDLYDCLDKNDQDFRHNYKAIESLTVRKQLLLIIGALSASFILSPAMMQTDNYLNNLLIIVIL